VDAYAQSDREAGRGGELVRVAGLSACSCDRALLTLGAGKVCNRLMADAAPSTLSESCQRIA
jgi:hypothetical protein